jgi:hypothetical protein
MKIHTQALAEFPVPRDILFPFATSPEMLSKVIEAQGPIPGVERSWVVGGGETKQGTLRRVILTDGTPLDEEVLEFEVPRKHSYRVKGYRGVFASLVKSGEAQWIFSPIDIGTRIVWRYEYELTSPVALPVALPFVKVAFQRYMQAALTRLQHEAQVLHKQPTDATSA